MSIALIVTAGFGNGTLSGSIPGVVFQGYVPIPPVEGAIAFTNASDALVSVGSAGILAEITFTSGADSLVSAGVLTNSGTISFTSANDTTVITGTAPAIINATGTISFTSADDTSAIAGTVAIAVNIDADISFTEQVDSASISGTNTVSGVIVGEGDDTTSIVVEITQPVFGDIAYTSANDSVNMVGEITQPIIGTRAFTNSSDSCSITAVITQPVDAEIAYTEENDTVAVTSELSFIIDTEPATIAKGQTGVQFVISGVTDTPTDINTTIVSGSASLQVNSVTGAGPYTINCTADVDIPLQAGSYPWTITVGSEDTVSSSIPLTVQSGWDREGLISPVSSIGYMLNGYLNTPPATGDDIEFEITAGLTVAANGEWIWATMPVSTQVVNRRVVQADGGVGATAAITFTV
jgi:hypothetical protein